MAKIVLVHGAFHELWGPHEITARWVPALRVEDHLVDNGHRAHDVEPYLNASVTGAAIAAALSGPAS